MEFVMDETGAFLHIRMSLMRAVPVRATKMG